MLHPDQEYNDKLQRIFERLAQGKRTVLVDCKDSVKFPADIIGFDEEYMSFKVKFHSDKLQKETTVWEKSNDWRMSMEEEEVPVKKMVPIKIETVWASSIIIDENL